VEGKKIQTMFEYFEFDEGRKAEQTKECRENMEAIEGYFLIKPPEHGWKTANPMKIPFTDGDLPALT
jgi:hypothetical protein